MAVEKNSNDVAADVLAVIRAPLEQYPPSLYQVALLAEAGLRVSVVDLSHPDYAVAEFGGPHPVRRYHASRHSQFYKEPQPGLLARINRLWKFRTCVQRVLRASRPRVVIAYDPDAIHLVGDLWRQAARPRLIWHLHELWALNAGNLRFRRATSYSYRNARNADLIVFPDLGRAEAFARDARLDRLPEVVMNCPRRREMPPADHLAELLQQLGCAGSTAVYFHGWIGPSRRVETVINSMGQWPKDSVLIAIGPIAADYRETLLRRANERGVGQRVFFPGSRPQSELWQLAAGAGVGISLVADKSDPNWVFSAGAINKRFEYMAVGLPQVANTGPGMRQIIEQTGCGLLADAESSAEIGKAIGMVLDDDALRARMRDSGRRAHLDRFNYEYQFAPVREQIVKWVRG